MGQMPTPRSPLAAATLNTNGKDILAELIDSEETFVGSLGRHIPMVYADELLVPLPGVPFIPCKIME